MAYLFRLFIGFLVLVLSGAALAQVACTTEYRGTASNKSGYTVIPGYSNSDLGTVCTWASSVEVIAAGPPSYQVVAGGANTYCGHWNGGTFVQSSLFVTSRKWFLKPDGTATQTDPGPVCSCPAGTVLQNGACVPVQSELEKFCSDHASAKNTFNQTGTVGLSSPIPSASCYKPYPPFEGADAAKGCKMTLGDGAAVGVPSEGLKHWSATGVMTGATCEDALATDSAPKAVDDPCPNGFPGTVNGEQRCVAAEPDKGIEGVKGTSQTNADGTKIDTKETTKCNGSVCTTTTNTTTTTASGTVTNTTSTRTESLDDKCVKDPKNDVCKKTQGGAGGATSSMTCDVNSSAEGCGGQGAEIGELYTKKDKTVGQVLTKAKNDLQSSPLGSSVTNFFNVGGGGSCPSISGTVPYVNATFTFDAYCGNTASRLFLILRAVLVVVATWAAFRIAIDN